MRDCGAWICVGFTKVGRMERGEKVRDCCGAHDLRGSMEIDISAGVAELVTERRLGWGHESEVRENGVVMYRNTNMSYIHAYSTMSTPFIFVLCGS